ncbi:MAG: hypothetical protein OCD03_05145 [Hyphomicrobiales bacterium]
MTEKQATKQLNKLFLPSALLYIVSIILAVWVRDHFEPSESFLYFWTIDSPALAQSIYYLLALIPIIAIVGMAWAQWRYINALDEFLRMIQIKGLLFGLLCVLCVATGWGLLEMLAKVAALPIFWLVPIFWFSQSIATGFIKARERGIDYEK